MWVEPSIIEPVSLVVGTEFHRGSGVQPSMADESERRKVVIVGIGDDGLAGLTTLAREAIEQADLILGPSATLEQLGEVPARREPLATELPEVLEQVRASFEARRPVLVQGGDPLFYGIARFLCDRLGAERFEVVPHVSSMQLAFARVKESWEDAVLINLAGRPLESVSDRIRLAEKVGLFLGEDQSPANLARSLLELGLDGFRTYVCENLGSPDERITQAELEELTALQFSHLVIMILVRKPDRPDRVGPAGRFLRFGNPDETFAQTRPKRGLITQSEVRALALAQLDVRSSSVVWDIGAGSGAVAIEAAQLADRGRVFAIEPEPADVALIQANAERFGVPNLTPVLGRAPEILDGLPDPDAIFIGGTGRYVAQVLEAAYQRLVPHGRIAANVAALESLHEAYQTLRRISGQVKLWQVGVARGIEQLDRVRFESVHPTFLLLSIKPAASVD